MNMHIFIFSASAGYHFTSYHSFPTYYSPYPSYSPVSSFALGYVAGSLTNHHHHYDYPYSSTHHHYYHHYNTNNNNNNYNYNGNDGSSGSGSGSNVGGYNNNFNINGNQNSNNFNRDSNQNATLPDPTKPMAPLVYSIARPANVTDDDSTEIVFINPNLIVGVENMVMYGEFQDEQDIVIIMEQGSDGLDPYPWDPMYALWYPNATSINENVTMNATSVEQTTASNDSHLVTTTEINTYISTSSIKTDTQSSTTDTNTMPIVPLAPLPTNTR